MKIYVLSYCQNEYQRERVKKFVESEGGKILNPDFGKSKRDRNKLFGPDLIIEEDYESIIRKADQIWIVLEGYVYDVFKFEMNIRELKLCRYFKINHVGRYVGRVREVERDFFKPNHGWSCF